MDYPLILGDYFPRQDPPDPLKLAALVLVLAAYFVPAFIAFSRGHRYKWVITVLSIAGGWTGFLWIVALAWAVWPRGHDQDLTP
jgi:hypothetical protein